MECYSEGVKLTPCPMSPGAEKERSQTALSVQILSSVETRGLSWPLKCFFSSPLTVVLLHFL